MPKHKKSNDESEAPRTHKRSSANPSGRALWSGSISFGLVNIPVKLVTAVKQKEVRFHLFREKDHCKVRQKMICETDQKEVSRNEIVKGFEIEEGRFAMLDVNEIENMAPKASREIDLIQFINLEEIDPIYYNKPYYLLPDSKGKKAYHLLVQSLEKSKKVGIAKFVMRSKQYLAALRIYQGILCLETMNFHDEIVNPRKFEEPPMKVSPKELEAAIKLIDSLTSDFHPEKITDDYRESLLELIGKKKKVKAAEAEGKETESKEEVSDLIAALEESLRQADKPDKTRTK